VGTLARLTARLTAAAQLAVGLGAALLASCLLDFGVYEIVRPDGGASTGGGGGGSGGNGDGGDGVPAGPGGFDAAGGSTSAGTVTGGGGVDDCTGKVNKGALLPLDMYIMLDRSLSMNEKTSTNVTKWEAVKQALLGFAADMKSEGIGVGIQYFPANPSCQSDADCPGSYCYLKSCNNTPVPQPCQSDAGCPGAASGSCVQLGGCGAQSCTAIGASCGAAGTCQALTASVCVTKDTCNVADYAAPAVAIAPLPGVTAAFKASLDAVGPAPLPFGFTATGPALQGAIDYTKVWLAANPTHTAIAVLVTDGLATQCAPSGTSAIAAIASVGLKEAPSVTTFTIGVFAPTDTEGPKTVAAIAQAGGGKSFTVDAMSDVKKQLIDALDEIRTEKLECAFDLPEPPPGEQLDFGKVNVEYKDASGTPAVLPYVGKPANCDPVKGGWFYDVLPEIGTPKKIIVCKASCNRFLQTVGGTVDILVGCATQGPT
jgi:hypothetical protein